MDKTTRRDEKKRVKEMLQHCNDETYRCNIATVRFRNETECCFSFDKNGVFLLNAPGYSDSRTKVRVPLGDNEAIYQLLGNKPEIPVEQETVAEYVDEPAVTYENIDNTSDIEKVRAACTEIKSRGEKPSRRKVAELTGIAPTKCGDILNSLPL